MSPLKSSIGRNLGKLLKGYRTSTLGLQLSSDPEAPPEITATGGSSFIVGNKKVHKFTSNDNFAIAAGSSTDVEILVIGGGGSGGGDSGGGGGAGAVLYGTGITYEPGTYAVVVGVFGGAEVPGYYGDPDVTLETLTAEKIVH